MLTRFESELDFLIALACSSNKRQFTRTIKAATSDQILAILEVIINCERFGIRNPGIRLSKLYPKVRINLIKNQKKVQLLLCLVLCEVVKSETALMMLD